MRILGIDIESYSDVDLAKSGVYAYCSSRAFEILLLAYAYDDQPVQVIDLASGETIPVALMQDLYDSSVTKCAYNAQFERVCLGQFLGRPIAARNWHCTMVQAAMMGLPRSLKDVGQILGLTRQKLEEGKDLIRYFCLPCKPTQTNGLRTRNRPCHDPERWQQFKAYNARDVEVERDIRLKLMEYPVPAREQQFYEIDQAINDRGVLVDRELVSQAILCDQLHRSAAMEQAENLTGLDNPNSVQQLRGWLSDQGVETETLDKKAVAELLNDTNDDVQEVLAIRRDLAKTSVGKYLAIERCVSPDDRVRGMFRFYGANRTGRFAGSGVQLHNLPRNTLQDLDLARQLLKAGDFALLEALYGSLSHTLSEIVRTAFIPAQGKVFLDADYSAIEARVLAWLAGEQWRLEVFRGHGKIYEASASQMFRVPIESITKGSVLRQKGKVAELACIAEGELVLTDKGLVPIEQITTQHLLWDGSNWVHHDGLVARGEREVMTYQGLTATGDHLVFVEDEDLPIPLSLAKKSGAHLRITGSGRDVLPKELEDHRGTARVYDVRNAGPHHRFTVSGVLVHNCGYGGGTGALIAMGALDMGLTTDELPGLIKTWRQSNPQIVRFWHDCDRAAIEAVREKTTTRVRGIRFVYEKGILFIELPSGRKLSYLKPMIAVNRFGNDSITFEGISTGNKWKRQETYGAKLVENITQAVARDILCEGMLRLEAAGFSIVMTVHDEVVVESESKNIDRVIKLMSACPYWAKGLPLCADGYISSYFMKD